MTYKLSGKLITLILFLSINSQSNASIIYYTFEGELGCYSCINPTGNANSVEEVITAGLYQDAPISYIFAVDYTQQGYEIDGSGNTTLLESDGTFDYFLIDYIAGDALGYAFESGYDGIYTSHIQSVITADWENFMIGDPWDNFLSVLDNPGFTFDTIEVGDSLLISNGVPTAELQSIMTLTSISSVNPVSVSEPSTLLLFGISILGILSLRFRKK